MTRLFALALLVGFVGVPAPVSAQPSLGAAFLADETATIELNDFAFTPRDLALKVGRRHRLILKNKGQVMHYFGSADFFKAVEIVGFISGGVVRPFTGQTHIPINPGDSKEVVVKPKEPGQFTFTCFVPTHVYNGMTGTITVNP